MKFMPGYPSWFFPTLLLLVSVIIISGLLLVPTFLFFTLEFDVDFYLQSLARKTVIVAHVLAGLFLSGTIGALFMIHMKSGWRRKQNRGSGAIATVSYSLLLLTATGALYFGAESTRILNNSTHTIAGLLYSFFTVFHIIKGIRIAVNNNNVAADRSSLLESQ